MLCRTVKLLNLRPTDSDIKHVFICKKSCKENIISVKVYKRFTKALHV